MEKRIRILHVDDNRYDRALVQDALREENERFEILEAASRESFKHYLEEGNFELVLSDFNILGFDGLQVLQMVKEKYPDMPVIIVTGTGSEEVAIQAMKMGADDYVIKSVKHIRGLASSIDMVLENNKYREELKKSESRYKALFSNMINGMAHCRIIVDEQGRPVDYIVLQVNAAYEQIVGIRKEDIEGRMVTEVFPEIRSYAFDYIGVFGKIALEGGELQFEEFFEATKQYFSIYVYRPLIGEFTTVFSDVTQRRKAEEELKESEKRFHSLFENMVEGFAYCRMIYDKGEPQDFIYLEVNQSFETLTGLKNVTGKKVSQVIPGIRDTDPELLESYSRVALTGNPERFENYVEALKMWFNISVYSPAKEYFVAVFDVITERKNAEEALKNHGLYLEQIVKQRTGELEAAKERAESADKLKSAFLSTTSHELRTPLNSIIGFSGILLQEIPGSLNEEQKKQLGIIKSSGQRLLSLINDILDLSKIEAGQMTVSYETFDVQQDIEDILTLVKPSADKKGLALHFEKIPGFETITSDKQRLNQVLLNVVNNAIKFTERGSVSVKCYKNANSLKVQITDTGIGIKEQYLETIFDPFNQINNNLTNPHEGTGLGLSISKKLVELLNGKIEVKSEYGAGTTFTITLPLK